jgi:hypothetical protein
LRGSALPGADADDSLGGNLQTLLRVHGAHILYPGVGVFDVEKAPGKGPSDDPIEPAARSDAGAVLSDFELVSVARGVMAERAVAVIPLLEQLFLESEIINLLGDFPEKISGAAVC